MQPSQSDPREVQRRAFLTRTGWGKADRAPLTADASTRRYERLTRGDKSAMFMDAPPVAESPPCPPGADIAARNQLGWNAQARLAASRVDAFVALARHLTSLGLSAPRILAFDTDQGFALLEDLGDAIFARVIEQGADEIALYEAAATALSIVHQIPAPGSLPAGDTHWPILDFDTLALRVNADLFTDWMPRYDARIRLSAADLGAWETARNALIAEALSYPRALILRDYHAENLIWLPERNGAKRVGLLDFQDAVNGWAEWDFAMLLQDARRTVSDAASEATICAYLDRTGGDRATFDHRLAVLGALNALRVAGVFARLVTRDNKPKYNAFQPRQLDLLARNLAHPALSDMRSVIESFAPHIVERAS